MHSRGANSCRGLVFDLLSRGNLKQILGNTVLDTVSYIMWFVVKLFLTVSNPSNESY